MPTYVYKFIDSGDTIEVVQAFTDPTLTEAVNPATGQLAPVKKVYTPVGVTFKGDGFYKTDNRNGSKRTNGSSGDSSSTSSTSGSSESTSSSSGEKQTAASAAAATPAPSAPKPSASSSSSSSSD